MMVHDWSQFYLILDRCLTHLWLNDQKLSRRWLMEGVVWIVAAAIVVVDRSQVPILVLISVCTIRTSSYKPPTIYLFDFRIFDGNYVHIVRCSSSNFKNWFCSPIVPFLRFSNEFQIRIPSISWSSIITSCSSSIALPPVAPSFSIVFGCMMVIDERKESDKEGGDL